MKRKKKECIEISFMRCWTDVKISLSKKSLHVRNFIQLFLRYYLNIYETFSVRKLKLPLRHEMLIQILRNHTTVEILTLSAMVAAEHATVPIAWLLRS